MSRSLLAVSLLVIGVVLYFTYSISVQKNEVQQFFESEVGKSTKKATSSDTVSDKVSDDGNAPETTSTPPPAPDPTNYVLLSENDQGSFVTVSATTLDQSGFVVIYRVNSQEKTDRLGVSELLSVGSHYNFKIRVNQIIAEGQIVVGVLYSDDGDGEFEFGSDAYLKEDGSIVSDIDVVDVSADRESAELQKQIEVSFENN